MYVFTALELGDVYQISIRCFRKWNIALDDIMGGWGGVISVHYMAICQNIENNYTIKNITFSFYTRYICLHLISNFNFGTLSSSWPLTPFLHQTQVARCDGTKLFWFKQGTGCMKSPKLHKVKENTTNTALNTGSLTGRIKWIIAWREYETIKIHWAFRKQTI